MTQDSKKLRQAREHLVHHGQLPGGLIDNPVLQRSWLRSHAAGLSPQGHTPGAPHASALQLTRARETQHELLSHARPAMAFVFEQIQDTHSVVLLADAQGMLLDALGDDRFIHRAERVALRPGANWHEQWRGTNAIGTAIAEGQPVIVQGSEHFLERNRFLSCAAAPITDPQGQLIGVINISSDHRQFHRHTLGVARAAARMVEHSLFETRHRHSLRLRFHLQREGIGGLTERLLALSEEGWLIGANPSALETLGLTVQDIGGRRLEEVLALDMTALLALASQYCDLPFMVHSHGKPDDPQGQTLWLRVELGMGLIETRDLMETRPVVQAAPLTPLPSSVTASRAALQRLAHQTVEECQGNLSEAARRLGISRNTLYRRLHNTAAEPSAH